MDAITAKISEIWATLSGISVLWAILAIVFALAIYFLPTILAAVLGNPSRRVLVIGVLDLIFGWTGLGWFALIAWAIFGRPREVELELADDAEAFPLGHPPSTA